MAKAMVAQVTTLDNSKPYAPSWFDHFKWWVEQLPIPVWLFYIFLSIIFVMLEFSVQWQAGNVPFGMFTVYHVWYVLQSVYLFVVLHYLDRMAAAAFDVFSTALDVNANEIAALRFKLTNVPARPALFITLIVTLTAPLWLVPSRTTYQQLYLESSPLVLIVNLFFYLLSFALGGFTVYHAFHQLRAISETYAKLTRINLFQLRPLYALSGVTVRTAVGFVVYMMLWSIALPGTFDHPASLMMAVPLSVFALIAFLLPLWGIHTHLVQAKEQSLSELGERTANAIQQLQRQADAGDIARAVQIKELLGGLETAQRMLEKIPTWPWQPDTLRLIISALLLPFVLFVVQFIISKFFAP